MTTLLHVALAPLALTAITAFAPPADSHDPVGSLDGITARGATTLTVKGWAIDPDRTSWAVRVRASVDGQDVPTATTLASAWRPDIADPAHAITPAHGYVLQVQAPATARQVCVRAQNIEGTPGADTVLGCLPIPLPPRLVERVEKVVENVPGVGSVTSIQVYPTVAGRDRAVADLDVWAAAKALPASHDFLTDFSVPGMWEQFVCHRNFAPTKPSWNLEPTRISVSYWTTVQYACNPPFKPGAGQ